MWGKMRVRQNIEYMILDGDNIRINFTRQLREGDYSRSELLKILKADKKIGCCEDGYTAQDYLDIFEEALRLLDFHKNNLPAINRKIYIGRGNRLYFVEKAYEEHYSVVWQKNNSHRRFDFSAKELPPLFNSEEEAQGCLDRYAEKKKLKEYIGKE